LLGGNRGDSVFLVIATVAALIPAISSYVERRFGASLGPTRPVPCPP